jgi:hypothetical protein
MSRDSFCQLAVRYIMLPETRRIAMPRGGECNP